MSVAAPRLLSKQVSFRNLFSFPRRERARIMAASPRDLAVAVARNRTA